MRMNANLSPNNFLLPTPRSQKRPYGSYVCVCVCVCVCVRVHACTCTYPYRELYEVLLIPVVTILK